MRESGPEHTHTHTEKIVEGICNICGRDTKGACVYQMEEKIGNKREICEQRI